MDSFGQSCHQTTNFRYNPNSVAISHGGGGDGDEFSGILEIYVHHARNIHNICIYENQDVYAKFSLTYNPDETLSTRIVNGGGKNPTFDENLRMEIAQNDAVLKCEIWMFSRVRNYMEDQLLGFTLVPVSQVLGKGKVTQEYSLSSTDLFHSPAGTVKLSLCFNLRPSLQINSSVNNSVSESVNSNASCSSISSEVVLLDRKISEVMLEPVEFSRIEFPDISVARENQQMVSEYFNLTSHVSPSSSSISSASACASASASRPNSGGLLPFLRLSASPQVVDDCEMTVNSPDGNHGDSISPDGSSIQNSGFFSSTTSLSDDRNSADSSTDQKKGHHHHIGGGGGGESSNSGNIVITSDASNHHHHQNSGSSCGPETPTSKKESESRDEKVEGKFSATKESESSINHKNKDNNRNIEAAKFGQVFTAPLGNINLEAEQSAMQQQIVDMYMRSMQQFTESLAKMKLPMDLNAPDREDCGDVIQNHSSISNNSSKLEIDKKNDRSRVFYGSSAFF